MNNPNSKPVNVAVVGLDFMGLTHIKSYQQIPGARIVAVCDAVRLPVDGVLTGVSGNIHGADAMGPREIARASGDLVERARGGRLKADEISGGTFTVSNLGMFRITRFAAIINPPEPAILAVGATQERAVVRDGEVVARPVMNLVLSCDHRATSGADGARLLDAIRQHLEEPLRLVL